MSNQKKENKDLKETLNNMGTEVGKITNNITDSIMDAAPEVVKKVKDLADDASNALKDSGDKLKKLYTQTKLDIEKSKLKPVFEDQVKSEDFGIPTIVHIVDYSKKHMESEACAGSIGYWDDIPKTKARVLNIYSKYANLVGMDFYPNIMESLYYLTPFEYKKYVDINEYFQYEEKLRVAELNDIACALGAKFLRINIIEQKSSLIKKKTKGKANADTPAASVEGQFEEDSDSNNYVLKEQGSIINLGGHNHPSCPKLNYYKNDPDILSLIKIRMDETNEFKNKTYRLKYNASSLIHKSQASQLDAAINMYEAGGNASISATYEEQNRMRFEYYIEFPSKTEKE